MSVNAKLQSRVDGIINELTVSQEILNKGVDFFIKSAEKGLDNKDNDPYGLPMIPTYVTSIPTGKERGVLLAADLGGTNFRVCSVSLNGDHTFIIKQEKNPIPVDLMSANSADELFEYLAKKIGQFVNTHHGDQASESKSDDNKLKLGFTFSFPVDQTSLDSGTLIRWTKGFNIEDCVGKDIVQLLQSHLDLLKIPVSVAALANDTVGTLLSRAYSAGAVAGDKQGDTLVGAIFGTGTNGAYPELIDNIKKLPKNYVDELKSKGKTHMVINTEWGSFDNHLEVLPTTKYDVEIDKISANPGYHMFEKRVSGMFLGEILRHILVDLYREGLILQQYRSYENLPHRLRTPWELSSEILSYIEIDDSTALKASELALLNALRLPTTHEERIIIQQLTIAIAKRAAYLGAIPFAGLLLKTKALEGHNKEVDIGVDGSLVEFYPGFRAMLRDALSMTKVGNQGERRVHINIAKDGSGVGAALCTLSD
ncbi:hypothetical protein PACTADRAFT_48688 [Pachysolen tannophilus NRRL Y-2460]|uniref:Phosphotransferase n=1 Tax=Pachysolen tannophilus NRRL Y-2460 TaxID=669874 RepID=A0A1E4TYQ6_PACTA|nr:hypothetical protein PACTADRAFT_48688 [Pachysolen tannophilus NRRL Y-2460]